VIPSSMNESPEAGKDWPGCGRGVGGDGDEYEVVVDGAFEDVGDVCDGGGTKGLAEVTKGVTIGLTGMGVIYVFLNVPYRKERRWWG
jgi:hypothetical protein